MRTSLWMPATVVALLALSQQASAQFGTPVGQPVGTPVGGTVVGDQRGFFGTLFGRPVELPAAPTTGSMIDTSNLAAPIPTIPSAQSQTVFGRLADRLSNVFDLSDQTTRQGSGYFPSLSRRRVQRNMGGGN